MNNKLPDSKLVARYLLRETLGLAVMAIALFWSAGHMGWWQAWALLAVMALWIAATALIVLRIYPELLAERLGPRHGAKIWDTAIMSMLGLFQLARYIVAGLDHRYAWSDLPLPLQIMALVFCLLAYALVVWATASNPFFSQIVRLQNERGHFVVTTGPYRYIRHPAYAGAIVYELLSSLALNSWWGWLVSLPNVFLLLIRTLLEDRSLQNELQGYREYTERVRYRLITGIW